MKISKISIVLLLISFLFCSCMFIKKNELELNNDYADVSQRLCEKMDNYISVDISETEDSIIIDLVLSKEYVKDESVRTIMPEYKIVEESRKYINNYVQDEPDSLLAKKLNTKHGFLSLYVYVGAGYYEEIFAVHSTGTIFDKYQRIRLSYAPTYTYDNEPGYTQFYDSYLEKMYEYLSRNSNEIYKMPVLKKKNVNDDEQAEWEESVKEMFPNVKYSD